MMMDRWLEVGFPEKDTARSCENLSDGGNNRFDRSIHQYICAVESYCQTDSSMWGSVLYRRTEIGTKGLRTDFPNYIVPI